MQIVRDKNKCIRYVQMKENPQDFVIKINKLTHTFEQHKKVDNLTVGARVIKN